MKAVPLRNNIIFVFLDDIRGGRFHDLSAGGIILGGTDDATTKQPRWGRVIAVGPKVDSDITIGCNILVEALMWTDGIVHDGVKLWQTNDTKVIGIEDIPV